MDDGVNGAAVTDIRVRRNLGADKQSSKCFTPPRRLLARKSRVTLKGAKAGIYNLATEVYPHRYTNNPEGEWQAKVFAATAPDGDFQPVAGNPIMQGQPACLFLHVFHDRFYGYD